MTNDHPPDGVDVSNIRALQKGHAHNVRRGTGEEADLLLADLIITDPHLIDLILEDGKREICKVNRIHDGEYMKLVKRSKRGQIKNYDFFIGYTDYFIRRSCFGIFYLRIKRSWGNDPNGAPVGHSPKAKMR